MSGCAAASSPRPTATPPPLCARSWTGTQLGAGTNIDGPTADRRTLVQVAGLTGVKWVDAAGDFSVAVRNDGTVWAWGDNSKGQLGDGTATNRTAPVQIGVAFGAPAAGRTHTVAATSPNGILAWGGNGRGQLGNAGTTGSSYAQQPVLELNKWNVCHEDLANRPGGIPVPAHPLAGNGCLINQDTSHPMGVIGVIAADDTNSAGIAGMAPTPSTASAGSTSCRSSPARRSRATSSCTRSSGGSTTASTPVS